MLSLLISENIVSLNTRYAFIKTLIMHNESRRNFIKKSLLGAGSLLLADFDLSKAYGKNTYGESPISHSLKNIQILHTNSRFEKEPLKSPFGFKGGYLSELWQSISYIKSTSGNHSIGLGTQSVLWSDASIFSSHSESDGNALMYALTERALQMIKGNSFVSPIEWIDQIFPEIYAYAKQITSRPDLRKTFVLNALVSVDNALWLLYAKENGFTTFDQLIPSGFKSTFSERHDRIAAVPLISYNVSPAALKQEVDNGYFFMKIKIGQAGSQKEMLEKDTNRLSEIHRVLKDIRTPYTETGKLPYYFDANGRYESKETFLRFLEHAEKIRAFDQIVLIEEPFPEEKEMDVTDIPVRLASDETAHTEEDTIKRLEMGYKAVALKPIAKTLSMSMKIAKAATERNIPCFCADLTVNPVLVEWNKNVAARLKPFPGLGNVGLLESNGHQNYANWDIMQKNTPFYGETWTEVRGGFYHTDGAYYGSSGGIFDPVPHYENMFK